MGDKDIIGKEVIRHLAVDMATYLLGLEIDPASLQLVETESQRVEDRRADLVAAVTDRQGYRFLLHIEIQNNNEPAMALRMLRYRCDIRLANPELPVRQFLIYIGAEPLRMADGLDEEGLSYRFGLVDMRAQECERWLEQDNPDALVLSILCDFKGRDPQTVVNHIVARLRQLLGDNPKRLREYIDMLEVLAGNRDLRQQIKEAEQMLTRIEIEKLPSYELGVERGISRGVTTGILVGERGMLRRQLTRRFGALHTEVVTRIEEADADQLELWGDRILTAETLEEVFG